MSYERWFWLAVIVFGSLAAAGQITSLWMEWSTRRRVRRLMEKWDTEDKESTS